ncbi:MAG: histidine phosphatase family protein, partial [Ferruginibacter sp.]
TGNNPGLLPSGLNRCGDLYRVLKNKKITGIYVTKYRRSQMTADSLSIYSHIPVIEYEADTSGNGLQEKITELGNRQKNILIIAHSNTIIPIIKKLGVANLQLKSISDEEYDNLFIIHAKKGKVKFIYKKFGDKSARNNDNRKMKPLQ